MERETAAWLADEKKIEAETAVGGGPQDSRLGNAPSAQLQQAERAKTARNEKRRSLKRQRG